MRPAPVSVAALVGSCALACACVPNDNRITGAAAPSAAPSAAPRPAQPGALQPRGPAPLAPGPLIALPFSDGFERADLGPDYSPKSPAWRIEGGRLCGRSARNQPVWLTRRLPKNARIEFVAESASADGDLKVEVWGDGQGAATGVSYNNATSYVVIFGGWRNTYHVLARIDEHAKDRPEVRLDPDSRDPRLAPVKPGTKYKFQIERADGRTVRWSVDGAEVLSYDDPTPLVGPGHEHFAFNDWEVPVCFDDLTITPLPD